MNPSTNTTENDRIIISTIKYALEKSRDERYRNYREDAIYRNKGVEPAYTFTTKSDLHGIILSYALPESLTEQFAAVGKKIRQIIPCTFIYEPGDMHIKLFQMEWDRKEDKNAEKIIDAISDGLEDTITKLDNIKISFNDFIINSRSMIAEGIARDGYYTHIHKIYSQLRMNPATKEYCADQRPKQSVTIAEFTGTRKLSAYQRKTIRKLFQDDNPHASIALSQINLSRVEYGVNNFQLYPIKKFKLHDIITGTINNRG